MKKCAFGSFSSGQKDHYKIEFYQSARQMVKDCIWADDQVLYDDESRDCTTIEFSSTQFFAIEAWILAQLSMPIKIGDVLRIEYTKQNDSKFVVYYRADGKMFEGQPRTNRILKE